MQTAGDSPHITLDDDGKDAFQPRALDLQRQSHHPSQEARIRSPSPVQSPRSRLPASRADSDEGLSSTRQSDQRLSSDEIDTFLELIYKHHPDPMTPDNMRQSVDALYQDWEQFCARRRVPVTLAKKPLMDEYGKIFNGTYGPEKQAKARSIAHELSQRTTSVSLDRDAQRRDSSSRRSLTHSWTDGDSDDEEADEGGGTTGGDDDKSGTQSLDLKGKAKADASRGATASNEPGPSKKPNIAQVGRNGLAVLPPGLFDILRNHLRDDILSSIMPSVRNDLTEQTRELSLQNQDLFGRIKEMEDRIRNQDLWIRHLLSRDPADMTPVGAVGNTSVEPATGMKSRLRPFSSSSRDHVSSSRHSRHGPSLSESEVVFAAPTGGAGPYSPRQALRNEPRTFAQHGMVGPPPWEGRSPLVTAGPTVSIGPGPGNAFGPGRWEAEGPPVGVHRDRPLPERRPSQASEVHRTPGSWQGEPVAGRGSRPRYNAGEQAEPRAGGYELPAGVQSSDPRLSLGERQRLSALPGGPSGPRGAAYAPPQSTGSVPTMMSGINSEFRRRGPPLPAREGAMSPLEPAYELRQSQQGFPVDHPGQYHGVPDPGTAPLPPRIGVADPSGLPQKNKRGRPSKVEMANSRADLGPSNRGSFSGSSHSRPYLS